MNIVAKSFAASPALAALVTLTGNGEILACGANSVQVKRGMNALIKNLSSVLPAGRHAALARWEERLRGTVERSFADADEKHDASVADRQGLGIGEEKAAKPWPIPSCPIEPRQTQKGHTQLP